MSIAVTVLLVALATVLFVGWVLVMNRLDARLDRRQRQAGRNYRRGLP
jgi:hypothetical protein